MKVAQSSLSFLLLVNPVCSESTLPPPPLSASQQTTQVTFGEEAKSKANVRSITDWPQRELIRAIPELKKLVPPESPEEGRERLPLILARVGANVKAFFEDFSNTTSVERLRTDRPGQDPSFEDPMGITRASPGFEQTFNYVALARTDPRQIGLDEYRTDTTGTLVEPSGGLVTKGFVSTSIHFHPAYQADSVFRYVGKVMLHGSDALVVVFAQRPGVARAVGQIHVPGGSPVVLVQGVAWIDPASFRIIRLRTDLLAPPPGTGLKRQTTEIEYGEVRFKQLRSTLWLPTRVTVTLDWRGKVFRNRHQYSDFRLFSVETEQKTRTVPP